MIEFLCSNIECGYSKAVSEAHLGKRAKCPKCKTVTRITDDEPVVDLAAIAEAPPVANDPYDIGTLNTTCWQRPSGIVGTIFDYSDLDSPLIVRFTNHATAETFDALYQLHTASDAYKDI